MECPACGHDRQRVLVTERSKQFDTREVLCRQCGTRFKQTISISTVYTRDPETMHEVEMKLDAFVKVSEAHLGRAVHPKMRGRIADA